MKSRTIDMNQEKLESVEKDHFYKNQFLFFTQYFERQPHRPIISDKSAKYNCIQNESIRINFCEFSIRYLQNIIFELKLKFPDSKDQISNKLLYNF